MSKAEELRKELDKRKSAERIERERRAEESKRNMEQRAKTLVPIMFRYCIRKCEKETKEKNNRARLSFSGFDSQYAATKVAEKLHEEGFEVKTSNYTVGFRMDSEGNTLSSGEPYVSFDISW